jgi:hypothetical protein
MKIVQWEKSFSIRTDGLTDRHGKANSSSSQLRECAYKPIPSLLVQWLVILLVSLDVVVSIIVRIDLY